jgi:hypothetical protein
VIGVLCAKAELFCPGDESEALVVRTVAKFGQLQKTGPATRDLHNAFEQEQRALRLSSFWYFYCIEGKPRIAESARRPLTLKFWFKERQKRTHHNQSSAPDGRRRQMSLSYQFVDFRASQACNLTRLLDRTCEPLDEGNCLRCHAVRIEWGRLRLFHPVFSPLALHEVSCARMN